MSDDPKFKGAGNPFGSEYGKSPDVSSEKDRQAEAAKAYDDSMKRSAQSVSAYAREADMQSAGYSSERTLEHSVQSFGDSTPSAADPFASKKPAPAPIPANLTAGAQGMPSASMTSERAGIQSASASVAQPQPTMPVAAQNFSSGADRAATSSQFAGQQDNHEAFKQGMETSTDQLGQAGVSVSSDFSTGVANSVQADARDAFSGQFDNAHDSVGVSQINATAPSISHQQSPVSSNASNVATQPVQAAATPFRSQTDRFGGNERFSDTQTRAAAVKNNMMTSVDSISQAGVASAHDFIEGNAVAVQADSRDAFSGKYDSPHSESGHNEGAPSANHSAPQPTTPVQGSGIGTTDPSAGVAIGEAAAEDKNAMSEASGPSIPKPGGATWASADMLSGVGNSERMKSVHLNKKIKENLEASRSAYSHAKQDFAAAEKDALDTLEASGWSSESAVDGIVDSAERASGFKDELGTAADGINRAGVTDSRDFGFMTQAERESLKSGAAKPRKSSSTAKSDRGSQGGLDGKSSESDFAHSSSAEAPENVRAAARKVIVEKDKVRKASDEMVAVHQQASEFITKSERRAQTVANFKSAAANAFVNSAVASIGDDSVAGASIRGTARAGVGAARAIKNRHGKGAKAAGVAGAVFSGYTSEGDDQDLNTAVGAVRSAKDIHTATKSFKSSRDAAKKATSASKKVSSKGFQTVAEKKAAAIATDAQATSMKGMMQRRSMSIAKAKSITSDVLEAEHKASLLNRVTSALTNAGRAAIQAVMNLIQGIWSLISGIIAAVVGTGGIGLLSIFAFIIILIILLTIPFFCDPSQSSVQGLNETETQVAEFFREKGLEDVQIAAIMGNMYGESGMNAGSEEGGGTNANGIGLCQWTNGRHTALVNYAKSVGKSWTDVQVQLDFFWDHDKWQSNWWSGYHINTYDHSSADSFSEDPPSGSYVEGSKKGFLAATDVKDAVRQFLYGWEVAGIPRLKVRYDAAEKYLDALQNGGDSGDGDHGGNGGAPQISGASARQQAIVNSAYATASPGQGLCAAWVSNVFRNAGYGFFGGNACDMCRSWCHSSNRSELKVGMIIADVSHPGTGWAGVTYGHVGIYIGNNKVMSNEGPITVKNLDTFINFYGAGTGCKWGWLGGIDLSN